MRSNTLDDWVKDFGQARDARAWIERELERRTTDKQIQELVEALFDLHAMADNVLLAFGNKMSLGDTYGRAKTLVSARALLRSYGRET